MIEYKQDSALLGRIAKAAATLGCLYPCYSGRRCRGLFREVTRSMQCLTQLDNGPESPR